MRFDPTAHEVDEQRGKTDLGNSYRVPREPVVRREPHEQQRE
jgi:hypothetical protein